MKVTQCAVAGCDHCGQMRRGMCNMHYKRARGRGELDLLPVLSSAERLSSGLVRAPNGCLEWSGSRIKGYGQIRADGKSVLTHRLAWELVNGPIPDGLGVLHHCDNPPCCETSPSEAYPEGHLFLGNDADNHADMMGKGRHRTNGNEQKTHCPADHEYTEANTYVSKAGRQCRICRSARQIRWRAEKLMNTKVEEAAA